MSDAILSLRNIRAGYGAIEVLKDVSLEVRAGEIVSIIGANGAGKTTTLMCISGINRVRRGNDRLGEARNSMLAAARNRATATVPVARGTKDFSAAIGARESWNWAR